VERVSEVTPVIDRIKRAQGQLGGVLRLIEEGRDCEDGSEVDFNKMEKLFLSLA